MSWTHDYPAAATTEGRAEEALRAPLGATSPLWFMFGAAASVGVAYWWMTRWARSVNIEALTPMPVKALVAPTLTEVATAPIAATLQVVEAVEAATPDPAIVESVAEGFEAPILEEAAEAVEETVEAGEGDDLTRLVGVGPKLAASLAQRGVTRFAQIAAWTEGELADVDSVLSLKGRAVRDAWVAQAKRLADQA
ncbi:MAG TPA: hypothetical protein VFE13_06395 [Caulobacteraceae bacterium]|nr:hypothetical protein [Caulobacteraceae bacterium]